MTRGWYAVSAFLLLVCVAYAVLLILALGWLAGLVLGCMGVVVVLWVRRVERRERHARLWRQANRGKGG